MGHFVLTKPIQNWLHFFIEHNRSNFVSLFIFDKLCATSYFLHRYCITMHGFHVLYFVEKVSYCLLSKPRAGFAISHFWIITLLECVRHSTQHTKHTLSLYICQVPNPSLFTFWQFWIKDLRMSLFFFGIILKLGDLISVLFEQLYR